MYLTCWHYQIVNKVDENLVCLTCQLFDCKSTITIKLNTDRFVEFHVINFGYASSEIEYVHKWNAKKRIANVNMKMTPRYNCHAEKRNAADTHLFLNGLARMLAG